MADRIDNQISEVARAVRCLAALHGLPNRFAISEIAGEARLSRLLVGHLLKRHSDRTALEICRQGDEQWLLTREPDRMGLTYIRVEIAA